FASLDCNFEDGLCNWHQETSDDFDWLRKSGSTPSSLTGPSSDHTTGYCENPIPNNALANSTNFRYGSVIEITCNTGYTLIGISPIVCQPGGTWSASPPACKPFDCGNRTIPNGKFSAAEGTTFGQTATHMCNIGYTLVGDMTVICTATGWNSTNATCEIIDCGDPTPKNAITNSTNYEYGSVIEITCNTGYSLTGESQMVCQDGGIWSASRPSCKPYGM
ncbi:CUB and sushi domain-containing protein 1-like, partial [Mercenaria mercenaria]|uniref:CUB and sushi domain-containing protein 1-like n=1 Tax=Mercenaria mercenaria TaxID=6596 RepID=UPI00234F3EBF